MKEFVPTPPPIVHNQYEEIRALFDRYVAPTYGRFELAFSHGQGSQLWDVRGRRYLDFGSGIAVCSLGHAHPEITETLIEQSRRLLHVSNLYYHAPQGELARELVRRIAPGKVFFANSGAEANEGLYKLARRFGHAEGRFEILTAVNSFHGRTLAGIAATGQPKVKEGFGPLMPGFQHVRYNDIEAARDAISPATTAILIEGIQGEGGITPATPEYLLGLRALCDEHNLLLLLDAVQCGHYRTGCFQSYQRILESVPQGAGFLFDGISMAKSLGGGFPMSAFWIRDQHSKLLGPGSHGTTFGGTPLGCSIALKILEVIEREQIPAHVRRLGNSIKEQLNDLAQELPHVIRAVRGLGFMVGIELNDRTAIPGFANNDIPAGLQLVRRLQDAGLLLIPSGPQVVRFLPPLNLTAPQAAEGMEIFSRILRQVA